MTGPILVWIFISREGIRTRIGVILGYLFLSVIFFGIAKVMKAPFERLSHAILDNSVDVDHCCICPGSLDEITAGLRVMPTLGQESLKAGVGRKLVLRGWIGSEFARYYGTTIKMTSRSDNRSSLEFQVKSERRPDVASFMIQPELEWGGFQAEAVIPKDFPLGRYKILVECRNASSRDQFYPLCEIAVVSEEEGASLDAPLEHKLADKKIKETQIVSTVSPRTLKKKSKPKNNVTGVK
jgi:hypothetical protein